MEEKKYPIIEEEEDFGSLTAAEPMVALAYPTREPVRVLGCGEDRFFDDGKTPSFGPATIEQAVNNLRKAEHQFAIGQWMSGDVFFLKTRKMIEQYAS